MQINADNFYVIVIRIDIIEQYRSDSATSANGRVIATVVLPLFSQDDDVEFSFRFVTGPTIGSHLIPNSDCVAPGYYEHAVHHFRHGIKLARVQ